jgi:hypothetical protein
LEKTQEGLQTSDCEKSGAPLIKKYIEYSKNEGYIYWLFENKDPESSYWEMMEFSEFVNIEMMLPQVGPKLDVTVKPNSYEIVLMKAKAGANYNYGEQDRGVILGDTALKQYCIDKNFFVEKDGPDLGLYKTWHDNGFITLYVNKTTNKKLVETLKYTLKGMTVENTGQNVGTVQINVGPG